MLGFPAIPYVIHFSFPDNSNDLPTPSLLVLISPDKTRTSETRGAIPSRPEFLLCLVFSPDYEPQTICEHLQYLFALLQNSKRRYIDPSGFVKALGLDTGQQQVCGRVFLTLPKVGNHPWVVTGQLPAGSGFWMQR